MLAAQGFSIGAEIASRPVDLLTLSEHNSSNSLSVQRRSVGQCSQSVMMLFQSLILSGGRDELKQLERNLFKAFSCPYQFYKLCSL